MAILAPRLLLAAARSGVSAVRLVCRLPTAARRRGFCVTSSAFVKYFPETENSFAHSVLRSIDTLQDTLVNHVRQSLPATREEFDSALNTDWSNARVQDVVKAFELVSQYGSENSFRIEDTIFDNICDALRHKANGMNDNDIASVLLSLSLWGPAAESTESHNFDLWKVVDAECNARVKYWKRKTLLYFADHWYTLKLVRLSTFMHSCNRKLARKPSALTPHELVQAMFYINVYRRNTSTVDMFEYEFCFEKDIDAMNINEIAIFAMGFFKCQTKFHSDALMSKIIDRTIESASSIESIPLAAILKVLKYSLRLTLADKLWALLDVLEKEIPRLTMMSCMHVALVGTNAQVFHEGVVKAASQRAAKEIESVRAKDLERFSLLLSTYDYDPQTEPCIYKTIVQELQNPIREEEFKAYSKSLVRCLYFLAQRNIYVPDLIARVLEPTYIQTVYGKNAHGYDLEVLGLDTGVDVECPTYCGIRLGIKEKRVLFRKYASNIINKQKKSMSAGDRMLCEIFKTAEEVAGGNDYICAAHILPHCSRPDIVFLVGSSGQFVRVPEAFARAVDAWEGAVLRPDGAPPEHRWCCLVSGSQNAFLLGGTERPNGPTTARLRQLRALGFSTALVPWYEWMRQGELQRPAYLQNIMLSLAQ